MDDLIEAILEAILSNFPLWLLIALIVICLIIVVV